ncbi:MAG: glycosyltransferase [Alistipes sp.]|nr:glycosyltransferase [Alistipes sp.]
MKISIITATFNSGATLRDTIQTVLTQTYREIEYIIIDGNSRDNTLEIVREFEPYFDGRMKWISEPDNGIYDAMNKGIRMATGDIIGILNSDDFYNDENVLADIVNAFGCKKTDCVYGNLVFVDSAKPDKIVRRWTGSQHTPGAFLKGWHPAHPTFYARRTCFEQYGDFDLSFEISADFELMLRFIEKNGCSNYYINRCFVKMRQGGASTGSIKNIIKGNKNILRAFRKNGYHISCLYPAKRLLPKLINVITTQIRLE